MFHNQYLAFIANLLQKPVSKFLNDDYAKLWQLTGNYIYLSEVFLTPPGDQASVQRGPNSL